MKRLPVTGWIIIVFTIAMTPINGSSALEDDFKNYFPLAQGNSWTYLMIDNIKESGYYDTYVIRGKEIVNGVETVKMLRPDGEYECIAADSEGIKLYKEVYEDEYEIFNPPLMLLPNIGIGESRSYLFNAEIYSKEKAKKKKGIHQYEIAIDSVEDVEVSAGKFSNCLKVQKTHTWKEEDGSHGEAIFTVWFAPGVGKVKISIHAERYEGTTGEKDAWIEICYLASAVIDGKEIGKE